MSDPNFSRRAAAPSLRIIWGERLREWIGGVVLIILILLGGVALFVSKSRQVEDVAGAALQSTNAVVMDRKVADNRGRAGDGWDITLHWNGKTAIANTHNLRLVERLAVGETVAVAYRVGKSGTVYVEDIAETTRQHVETNPQSR